LLKQEQEKLGFWFAGFAQIDSRKKEYSVIILSPTRELCIQIAKV
jgi:superfamily II DNA/RNA helicase